MADVGRLERRQEEVVAVPLGAERDPGETPLHAELAEEPGRDVARRSTPVGTSAMAPYAVVPAPLGSSVTSRKSTGGRKLVSM